LSRAHFDIVVFRVLPVLLQFSDHWNAHCYQLLSAHSTSM